MKSLLVVGVIVLLLLIGGCSGYKNLVSLDEGAKAQWSQVDVQLQRRYDLIPNLVSTVKGYAAHEKGVFDDVANARQAYTGAATTNDQAKAAGNVEGALSRLLAISENYPNLKADASFLALQDQLEGTENRISVERKRYNDDVQALDTALRSPFSAFINIFAHIAPRDYFNPPAAVQAVPKVDFSAAPAVTPAPAPAAPVPAGGPIGAP